MVLVRHLCPKCTNAAIKDDAQERFMCWFCEYTFEAAQTIKTEGDLSANFIRQTFRRKLGCFIKKLGVRSQMNVLQKAFTKYEEFCSERELKTYSAQGLDAFISSVTNWQTFCSGIGVETCAHPSAI